MKKSRFSEVRIIGVLKERDAGTKAAELCLCHGMSPAPETIQIPRAIMNYENWILNLVLIMGSGHL